MIDDSAAGTSVAESSKMIVDSAVGTTEDDIISTQELSVTAELNPTLAEMKMKTPAKRGIEDNGKQDVLSAKLCAKIQEQLPVAESSRKDIEFIQEQVVAINDSLPIQPNVSASAENDMSASSHKTPAKRSSAKQILMVVSFV
ncbi:hypothetical protein L195_g017826 [Trifolium pratense]|uniref:Uncharacterized protein n=1 Tax=Trifolium pratense TaxID=57577 RepID=A0A2K3MUZ6_TRIPR|nr:hypothetical protein L195_g017826 [Trifolium pratense]